MLIKIDYTIFYIGDYLFTYPSVSLVIHEYIQTFSAVLLSDALFEDIYDMHVLVRLKQLEVLSH